jgi:hypothetical protein
MAKLLVYLDDDWHEDLKELAHRKKTTMAALVRLAIDNTFEDELDAISAERGWDEYLADPSSAISLDDYLKERGIVLPDRVATESDEESRAHPRSPTAKNSPSRRRTAKQPVS